MTTYKKLSKLELKQLESLHNRALANMQETSYMNCVAVGANAINKDPNEPPRHPDAVQATLDERGSRYGDFSDHARLCVQLKDTLRFHWQNKTLVATGSEIQIHPWVHLSAVQQQAIEVICDKLARILNGDPYYADNWHDIQGYAKLVEDRLPK